MSLIRPNLSPSPRDLRVFGFCWLFFFGALGALAWQRGAPHAPWILWFVGFAVAGPGWFFLRWLRLVYLAATYAGMPIGIVTSFLLLASVYYLVLSPIGLLLRLAGHDPLARGFQPGRRTYWKTRKGPPPPPSYFHQN